MSYNFEQLPLKTITNSNFTLNRETLLPLKDELQEFLQKHEHMNNKFFSKNVMFTHELKANNNVEGINDDVTIIEKVIENAKSIKDVEKRNRIYNLYKGYRYILKEEDITEDNIAKLYKILSENLLEENDLKRMGEKYREDKVYILYKGRLDESIRTGIDYKLIPEYINYFLEYVNNGEQFSESIDYFIKSQIMHFYFVYIHPYFDLNGRSSRTIAMWYLLKNKAYPYIIFNRAITLQSYYDKLIRITEDTKDLTLFIKKIMIDLKKELEKEYIMHNFSKNSSRKWTALDYQTMEYFLTMKGEKNVLNYQKIYNAYNDKKYPKEIFEKMLLPLIEDETFSVVRTTQKNMFDCNPNLVLTLNPKRVENLNLEDITRLTI